VSDIEILHFSGISYKMQAAVTGTAGPAATNGVDAAIEVSPLLRSDGDLSDVQKGNQEGV
jgi:hypothetical protein